MIETPAAGSRAGQPDLIVLDAVNFRRRAKLRSARRSARPDSLRWVDGAAGECRKREKGDAETEFPLT